MGVRNVEDGGTPPTELTPHKTCVTTQVGHRENPELQTDCFEHIVAKIQSPAGVVLINQAGQTVAFYPYDHVVKVIAAELDKPKSDLVIASKVVPFPGIH